MYALSGRGHVLGGEGLDDRDGREQEGERRRGVVGRIVGHGERRGPEGVGGRVAEEEGRGDEARWERCQRVEPA